MGSLSSTPKAATAPVPATVIQTSASEEVEEVNTQELESEERKKNLLARDRSRAGLINTTLKGVLSTSDDNQERKTLLGQ